MDFAKRGQNFLATRGLIGGLFDDTGDKAMDELAGIRNIYDSISLPGLRWEDIDPELISPESANYSLVSENPITKSMQANALARMAGLAETGLSDVDAAGFNEARSIGSQMARANTQAALQDAQNRGVGGSGLEFALREMAGQGGAQRAQEAGLKQAADSARQRALYAQAYGDQVSGARDQDYRTSAQNSNIINQFNMANTQARNAANQVNVQARNDAARYNQEQRLGLKQQGYQNQLDRARGQADASTNIAKGYWAQNAANQDARNKDTETFTGGMMMGFGG